jgi:hypothetical protein
MILSKLFRRPNPAAELARMGHQQYRDRVHAQVDRMREQMGMPPAKWSR